MTNEYRFGLGAFAEIHLLYQTLLPLAVTEGDPEHIRSLARDLQAVYPHLHADEHQQWMRSSVGFLKELYDSFGGTPGRFPRLKEPSTSLPLEAVEGFSRTLEERLA